MLILKHMLVLVHLINYVCLKIWHFAIIVMYGEHYAWPWLLHSNMKRMPNIPLFYHEHDQKLYRW